MSLRCRSLFAPSLIAVTFASAVHAQAADSHKRALFFSVEAAAIPDAFSARCGRGGAGGLGWGPGGALLMRPRPWLIVQGDARVVMSTVDIGCIDDLPIVRVDSNTWESRPGADFPSGTPGYPFATTTFRVGLETPSGLPLVRTTIGAGLALGKRPAPIGTATLGLGTRGNGKRFYLELELNTTRVKATERRTRTRVSAAGEQTNLGTSVVPVVIRGPGGALRAGIEIPLSR